MVAAPTPAVRLDAVTKTYGGRRNPVPALRGVTFEFAARSFVAVMGPSGSGKSTLLNCAAGLVAPTSGTVTLGGDVISDLPERRLSLLRRDRIGFVFQSFNLLPALTLEQNVVLPLKLAGTRVGRDRVEAALAAVGLADRRGHRPAELSGGQQQRAAIARALITRPAVVFADEPTGALDTTSAADVLAILRDSVDTGGQTIVMVTHDPVAASYADAVAFLADGLVVDVLDRPTADAVAERMTSLGAFAARTRELASAVAR